MKQLLTLILSITINISFSQNPNECGNTDPAPPITQSQLSCSQTISYAPDDFTQTKIVRIALHVVQKNDGTGNFQDTPTERNWLENIMVNDANYVLGNLQPMNLTTTSPYIQNSKIQFEVDDIFFHQNTYLWDFNLPNGMRNVLARVKGDSLYNQYVTNNPAVTNKTNTIHVFLVDQSGSLAGRACGIPCTNWSVVSEIYQKYLETPSNFWLSSNILRHELGHNLGLGHSNDSDNCDDTPIGGPFCWNSPTCSNNMMDYNAGKNALTECQLGIMHYNLENNLKGVVINDCSVQNNLIINNGVVNVWINTRTIQGNLIIEPNSTLIVQCTVNMPKEGKIIIKKGGKLIVDGGTITNQCGQLWGGIEVNGDRNASQLTAGAQGSLEIKNNAVIENARFAVRTTETDANDQTIWNTFGGIVKVSNSTFKNNRSGIDFSPYQNFIPNNPISKIKDLSTIKNNTFIWDNTGNLEALGIPFYSHIGMWDNHGIDVVGNTFKNDHPISTPQYQTGIGVIAYDADCRVINNCVSPFYPCPTSNIIPNQFDNLKIGVHALGISNIARMHIDGNVFNNNKYGVVLEAAHYSSVIRNEFNVPISNLTLQQGGNAIGIYTTNAFGYNFEENTFNSTGPEPVNGSNYAIVADNSLATGGGLVYKNEFNNMIVGTVSSNINSQLKIDCNNYTAGSLHQYDWAVTSGNLAPQGNCNNPFVLPAKNAFSANCTGEKHIFVDGSANLLLYSALNNDLPICYTGGKVFGSLCPTGSNTCLSNFANPLSGPQLLSSIGALNNEINTNLLTQLDGGNTQNLMTIINSEPDWKIRNELMAVVPYLSDQVLLTLLNSTAADWVLQQVLTANAPLSDEVFLTAVNKTPALPDYLIKDLALASSPLHTTEQLAIINHSPKYADWVLSDIMLQNSPLKEEVLVALMEVTPYVSHSTIRNILLQNTPLSVVANDVMSNHLPNYPSWVINAVNNSNYVASPAVDEPQPLSPATSIVQEVAYLTQEAQLLKNEFIRMCLDSHQLQDVSTILSADKTVADKIALFRLTVADNTPFAGQMITELMADAAAITAANTADGTAGEIEQLCSIYAGIHDAYSNTGSFDSLTGANEVTVTNIANTNSATAVNAQVILNLFNATTFDRFAEPISNNTSSSRLSNTASNNNQLITNNYGLSNYPNPFNTSTIIEVNLPEATKGQLIITDIAGRVIKTIVLAANDNKIEVSGNLLSTGIYYYSLWVDDELKATKKMVKTH